ncbi:hypothetical protein [Acaryochloris sp. CCMEE 5410]|uniref:hypothetical protein n=1 Tax=Acaryochloris sp. CCMEE 5410 TaxID=310037 RepID=UPI0002483EB7|nr:hypothetical protein [Acaryochloris sp. CCMEE 5410]KAI9129774.1 hypothetical protein ON05_032065 [Acaryochloris sp. CCMEE 5410]
MSFTGYVEDFLRDINAFSNFSAKLSASLCFQIRLSATLRFQAVCDHKYEFNERIGFLGQQRQGNAFKKRQGNAFNVNGFNAIEFFSGFTLAIPVFAGGSGGLF